MCLRKRNALIYMCLCFQFWFMKNQTVVQNPHYNHVLHKKKTFALENYTKSVHSYRVNIHPYDTSILYYHITYTQEKRTYTLIMSHTQNNKK